MLFKKKTNISDVEWNEFIDDISQYEITEHELNKPVVISFFQAS